MAKTLRAYRELRQERLSNPVVAAHYLNATLENSPEQFLAALKNVASARQMTEVAKDGGTHRSLSEQDNPTWDTLKSMLDVLSLKVVIQPLDEAPIATPQRAAPGQIPTQAPTNLAEVAGEPVQQDTNAA